jgi:hypothetical protein
VCSHPYGRGAALYRRPGSAQERDNGDNSGQASARWEAYTHEILLSLGAPVPACPPCPTRKAGTIYCETQNGAARALLWTLPAGVSSKP